MTSDQLAVELAFWDAIKDSKESAMFEAYLLHFPNGKFAEIAKLKIKILQR